MNNLTTHKFPTSFGVFSPTGHIVMAFANDNDAENARQALINGGFASEDVTRFNSDEVTAELTKSEDQNSSPIQIGQDLAKVEEFLTLAREGCGFLIVHAPKGKQSKLAIALVHPYGLKFAEKYNWLTIEELA